MTKKLSALLAYLKDRPIKSAGVVILIVAAIIIASRLFKPTPSPYITATVEEGDLTVEISATGTVEPEEVIDVGAQVAGQIVSFGVDESGKPIDYGSKVSKGMVLARIDESIYQTEITQAEAQLKKAEADLAQNRAKFNQTERDWKRAQELGPSEALSKSAFDSYQANFETAKANISVSEASIAQAEATMIRAKRNLQYCVITSPVDGVIIDRRVNIGQTVVASLNAPSLFLIAKDLRRMEVWLSVNEADVGRIFPGQKVSFTVDAFPGESFVGEVLKLRLNASMNQNVVTYIVEVITDNSSGRLLPYLTANARFKVLDRHKVLLVPNSAFRFSPRENGKTNKELASWGGQSDQSKTSSLWIDEEGTAKRISVVKGATDGIKTEIESSKISLGTRVIIGERVTANSAESGARTSSPFAPTVHRGGGGGRR